MQQGSLLAHLFGDGDAVAEKHALIAGAVGHDVDFGGDVGVTLDQSAHGRREAGRQSACGQHCDFLFGHWGSPLSVLNACWGKWMRQPVLHVK